MNNWEKIRKKERLEWSRRVYGVKVEDRPEEVEVVDVVEVGAGAPPVLVVEVDMPVERSAEGAPRSRSIHVPNGMGLRGLSGCRKELDYLIEGYTTVLSESKSESIVWIFKHVQS